MIPGLRDRREPRGFKARPALPVLAEQPVCKAWMAIRVQPGHKELPDQRDRKVVTAIRGQLAHKGQLARREPRVRVVRLGYRAWTATRERLDQRDRLA